MISSLWSALSAYKGGLDISGIPDVIMEWIEFSPAAGQKTAGQIEK
jgi:hypothetical protein